MAPRTDHAEPLPFLLALMSLLICVTISFLMPIAESPLLIGALVLIMSVVRALILSEARTWLALLLLLIYVGGMLVTFSYLLALCPNQSVRLTPFLIFPVIIALIFLQERANYESQKSFEVLDIYRELNFMTLILLGVVLFLAIVRVVKIVRRSAGALRPFKI